MKIWSLHASTCRKPCTSTRRKPCVGSPVSARVEPGFMPQWTRWLLFHLLISLEECPSRVDKKDSTKAVWEMLQTRYMGVVQVKEIKVQERFQNFPHGGQWVGGWLCHEVDDHHHWHQFIRWQDGGDLHHQEVLLSRSPMIPVDRCLHEVVRRPKKHVGWGGS